MNNYLEQQKEATLATLIAIEGIDGSGKGTQAKRLQERLVAEGKRAALLSFPRYRDTLFGEAIGQFLNGEFGTLNEVNPFLAALLYAGDRSESKQFLLSLLAENDVVVLDRYVASNIAHQGAKATGDAQQKLIKRIQTIEFEINHLPQANMNILLDLPALEARKLIAKKNKRDYTDKEADLQEEDTDYLESVRNVYLQLATDTSNWQIVSLLDKEGLRSIESIGDEIYHMVTE
ncbi:Thymidylate kinase [hydrothermal vent metagenome]|uniref:dTMP kinase n=1 Tax=hydrothermal vent metagenome TaxID=652676 RepID=A0A3B1E7D9_9ZZZZ